MSGWEFWSLVILIIICTGWMIINLRLLAMDVNLVRSDLQSRIDSIRRSISEEIGKTTEEIDKMSKHIAVNKINTQGDALINSLSRMTCFEDFEYLGDHYKAIQELLELRDEGIPEKEIVEERMNYDEPEDRGFKCPVYDDEAKEWEISVVSPYRVATLGIDFRKVEQLCEERLDMLRKQRPHDLGLGYVWNPEYEAEGTKERLLPVYYEDERGESRRYPEDEN